MKKFLFKISVFSIFAFIFYFFFNLFWSFLFPRSFRDNLLFNPNEGFLEQRMLEIENFGRVDILFLGSSHAYRGFDTRIFKKEGIKSFNLGSSAQTHIQTRYLLKKYIDEVDPELVVYEVFPDMFSNEGVEATINIVSASDDFNKELMNMVIKTEDIRAYNTMLLSLFLNITNRKIEPKTEEEVDDEEEYISGGFVEVEIEYNDDEPQEPKHWSVLEKQKEAFKENIHFLKSRNIPYILVQAPHIFHIKIMLK